MDILYVLECIAYLVVIPMGIVIGKNQGHLQRKRFRWHRKSRKVCRKTTNLLQIMRDNILTISYRMQHPIKYYLALSFGALIGILLSPILLPLMLYFSYRVNKNIKEHIKTLD